MFKFPDIVDASLFQLCLHGVCSVSFTILLFSAYVIELEDSYKAHVV